jgi:SAM-dependent methyltransferase
MSSNNDVVINTTGTYPRVITKHRQLVTRSVIKRELPATFNLDLGCGANCQDDFIGMDRRDLPGVDIIHDIEEFPWPINTDSVKIILCSHLLEHLDPRHNVDFFNECHRILAPGGMLCVAVPYANSVGAYQDPTHTRPGFNEHTWSYFDPRHPLWSVYKPRPFFVEDVRWVQHTNMEVRMRCIKPSEWTDKKLSAEEKKHLADVKAEGF